MKDNNIQSVDFSGKDELKAALEEMRRGLESLPEIMLITAQRRMITYECHIAAGFDPDQALELCKNLSLL